MESQSRPGISVSLSLSPDTYALASSQIPNLNITITSHYPVPITIYADDLSPSLMLKCGAFIITSMTTGSEIKQIKSTHCRIPPPSKVAVPLNENLFHTLFPNIPLTLSAPLARNRTGTSGKPPGKDYLDYTSHRSAKYGACGIDALEPGHKYALSLASNPRVWWDTIRWWEYGTKEQVLHVNGNENKLDGRRVKFGPGPHEAIQVDRKSIRVVTFQCLE